MRHTLPLLLLLLLLTVGCTPAPEGTTTDDITPSTAAPVDSLAEIERLLTEAMAEEHVPGFAVALIKDGGVAFAKGFGHADLEAGVPMTADTVMNVASISKTFTNAAVLQLWEEGRIQLDDDVNGYLPFRLIHPLHPEKAITFRHLLTHRASIDDGEAYRESYACGDPAVSLSDWIEGYLVAGGKYYNAEEGFHDWEPGEKYAYSNVGYGLLGYLVEQITGESFGDYTRRRIFEPLGMHETSWYLADLDLAHHAVPYTYFSKASVLEPPLFVEAGSEVEAGSFAAFCQYSFYNVPDGLVRTSVRQLARYLLAHMGGGVYEGGRILKTETVDAIWSEEAERSRLGQEGIQGLTWSGRQDEGLGLLWGHNGGDPGVSTHMYFRPETGVGVIVFANAGVALGPITRRLFEVAEAL